MSSFFGEDETLVERAGTWKLRSGARSSRDNVKLVSQSCYQNTAEVIQHTYNLSLHSIVLKTLFISSADDRIQLLVRHV